MFNRSMRINWHIHVHFHTGSPTPRLPLPSSESEVDDKEAPAELNGDVVVHSEAEDVEEEGVDMEEEASDSPLLTGELSWSVRST